jgi:hypothetical protein
MCNHGVNSLSDLKGGRSHAARSKQSGGNGPPKNQGQLRLFSGFDFARIDSRYPLRSRLSSTDSQIAHCTHAPHAHPHDLLPPRHLTPSLTCSRQVAADRTTIATGLPLPAAAYDHRNGTDGLHPLAPLPAPLAHTPETAEPRL